MKVFKSYRHVFLLAGIFLLALVSIRVFKKTAPQAVISAGNKVKRPLIPSIEELTKSPSDVLILYGMDLINSTSRYFGANGIISHSTNGLNCGNCHLESGTKLFTNNFLGVASTYPRFRPRSGKMESVEFRVNECLQRSLNGSPIDSLSKEMKAMVAYIKWTGKHIQTGQDAEGVKTREVVFLETAANPSKGLVVYQAKCRVCHGANGEGLLKDSSGYTYPPLWGEHSYAVSAGMYRLTKLASFIKYNMPNGANYNKTLLTDEEVWNVAAYINSQPHPAKMFRYDWPSIATKPVDYPFGPYTDTFSGTQHKYGPFAIIEKAKTRN